jgi:hypothetical protein
MQPKDGPVPTFLCRNRAEVTAALVRIREHLGISQLELDEIAGFHLGYTGKLERPDTPATPGQRKPGRAAINPMFDPWLGALGVALVLLPLAEPEALAVERATPPPARLPKVSLKTARRIRTLHGTQRYTRMELAGKFGLALRTISDIVEGRTHTEIAQEAA